MKSRNAGYVTLQEVSRLTGVSLSALNYYVNLGLIHSLDRQGNTRLFHRANILRRLDQIRRFRREGYPLRIIRRLLRGESLSR